MSMFFPYDYYTIVSFFSDLYSFDYSSLTDYQRTILLLSTNLYFFVFWFIIVYFALKIFNRIWERFL